jgi:low affinity Fe/Cu permease
MQNKIVFAILALVIIGGIISFTINNRVYQIDGVTLRVLPKVVKLTDVYNKDISNIKALLIRDGNTGDSKVTEDTLKIKEFFEIMQEITFIKDNNQKQTVGWSYYVDLYESDDKDSWFRILFARTTFSEYITKPRYKVESSPYYKANDIDKVIEKLDKYYDSIE